MELYDNHNHSQFSFDGGRTSVEEASKAAIAKGLAGMCFTDHMDLYTPPMKASFEDLVPEEFDIEARNSEIDKVRATLGGGLKIFKGIELGLYKDCREGLLKVLEANEFDQVIASVHYLDETDPYWGGYYDGKTWKQAYGHYLETIVEEASWLGERFDILGHYDYVVRYAPYPEACMRYRDFADIFDSIFRQLISNGQSLEYNSKSYQDFNGRMVCCDPDVLLRYRELGGEAISLGSDSHKPEHVGFRFKESVEYLKSLGFKHIAHYEGRRRVLTGI